MGISGVLPLLVLSSCFCRMAVLLASSRNDTEIFSVPVIPGGYPSNTNSGALLREARLWSTMGK